MLSSDGSFGVYWPPREMGRSPKQRGEALLNGTLSVFEEESDPANSFHLHITLRRPDDEAARVRWNKNLAFPEYSWMAQVRVWDPEHKWLWPNLPYLLRAHGRERVERYGGVDPGKGVDNDFAAVLIRPLGQETSQEEQEQLGFAQRPLVSAEWRPVDAEGAALTSVVHVARSDEFTVRLSPIDRRPRSGKLGVWLIYADFLDAGAPRSWPKKKEFAGGILAYLEVAWRRDADGAFKFHVEHLVPPSDTGFDWESWSTGLSALEKHLEMTTSPGA